MREQKTLYEIAKALDPGTRVCLTFGDGSKYVIHKVRDDPHYVQFTDIYPPNGMARGITISDHNQPRVDISDSHEGHKTLVSNFVSSGLKSLEVLSTEKNPPNSRYTNVKVPEIPKEAIEEELGEYDFPLGMGGSL